MIRLLAAFSLVLAVVLGTSGCGGARKVLSVKSEPADAEVCIKGKATSQYFSSKQKSCIGNTPLELTEAEVVGPNGEKNTVNFKDVDDDRENFYILVSHPGYSAKSTLVPNWDQFLVLKQEGSIQPAPTVAAAPTNPDKGSLKVTSNPTGALVYINDILKGNTPYIFEGPGGSVVKVKIEQRGYDIEEKQVTIDSGKMLELNLTLVVQNNSQHQNTGRAPAMVTQQPAPAPAVHPQTQPQTQVQPAQE